MYPRGLLVTVDSFIKDQWTFKKWNRTFNFVLRAFPLKSLSLMEHACWLWNHKNLPPYRIVRVVQLPVYLSSISLSYNLSPESCLSCNHVQWRRSWAAWSTQDTKYQHSTTCMLLWKRKKNSKLLFCPSRRTHIFTEGRLSNTNNRRKVSLNGMQYLPALYFL